MDYATKNILTQALRTLIYKVCCDPEGLWGKIPTVEYLGVNVPTPESLIRIIGPTMHQYVMFLPERIIQDSETGIRGLAEFQTLYQLLRQVPALEDINTQILESYTLNLLTSCVERNLNKESRGLLFEEHGKVRLYKTGFQPSVTEHCSNQIDELAQVAAATPTCTLYAPLHGFHIEQFGAHIDFEEGLSVVHAGEVPIRVLVVELRGKQQSYIRNGASHYLKVEFKPTTQDRNNRACFPEAAKGLAAFLAALRIEFRGWVTSANMTIDFNLPWLLPRYYVVDQNLPVGGLYNFRNTTESRKNVANRFKVLLHEAPSLACDPPDDAPLQYLVWALSQMDSRARASHETARAAAIFMAFDGLFGEDGHGEEKWTQYAKLLVRKDCWLGRRTHEYLREAYKVRNALFHEGRPPGDRAKNVLLPLLEDLVAITVRWILDSKDIQLFGKKAGFLRQLTNESPKCYCPRPPGRLPPELPWGTRTMDS